MSFMTKFISTGLRDSRSEALRTTHLGLIELKGGTERFEEPISSTHLEDVTLGLNKKPATGG